MIFLTTCFAQHFKIIPCSERSTEENAKEKEDKKSEEEKKEKMKMSKELTVTFHIFNLVNIS